MYAAMAGLTALGIAILAIAFVAFFNQDNVTREITSSLPAASPSPAAGAGPTSTPHPSPSSSAPVSPAGGGTGTSAGSKTTSGPPSDTLMGELLGFGAVLILAGAFWPRVTSLKLPGGVEVDVGQAIADKADELQATAKDAVSAAVAGLPRGQRLSLDAQQRVSQKVAVKAAAVLVASQREPMARRSAALALGLPIEENQDLLVRRLAEAETKREALGEQA